MTTDTPGRIGGKLGILNAGQNINLLMMPIEKYGSLAELEGRRHGAEPEQLFD